MNVKRFCFFFCLSYKPSSIWCIALSAFKIFHNQGGQEVTLSLGTASAAEGISLDAAVDGRDLSSG